jgi:glycosyltransferase involved in cell wall biosynthesis
MKHILFVITQSEIGGAQQFLTQLVSHISKEIRCTIAVGADGAHELRSHLPLGIEYRTVAFLRRNPNIFSDIQSLFELRGLYRELKPDIIFLNSSKAGFNGSLAALGLPTRIIYRIGGWAFNDPRPGWQKFLYRLFEKVSAGWKDDIIVNNQKDLQDAQRFGIHPRRKLHLIHNGIDPYQNFLSPDQARLELQNRIGRPGAFQNKPIVGTIANFYPAKGLSDFIVAAQKVPDTLFIIIGDGILRSELEKEIRGQKLQDRVFLTGKMEFASQYLPAFDLFVLPSLKEGFPWVLLEAMAAKIPIVATSVGAVPEVLKSNVSGYLVTPGNPVELAHAIRELLSNDRLRRELPVQAHQQLLKRFSTHTMIKRYEELLLELSL